MIFSRLITSSILIINYLSIIVMTWNLNTFYMNYNNYILFKPNVIQWHFRNICNSFWFDYKPFRRPPPRKKNLEVIWDNNGEKLMDSNKKLWLTFGSFWCLKWDSGAERLKTNKIGLYQDEPRSSLEIYENVRGFSFNRHNENSFQANELCF